MAGGGTPAGFTAVKNNIAVRSFDSSALVDGLTAYLGQHANLIAVDDKENSLEDALFFGKVDSVISIPAGFTESFMDGSNAVQLERASNALSGSAVNTDLLIGR